MLPEVRVLRVDALRHEIAEPQGLPGGVAPVLAETSSAAQDPLPAVIAEEVAVAAGIVPVDNGHIRRGWQGQLTKVRLRRELVPDELVLRDALPFAAVPGLQALYDRGIFFLGRLIPARLLHFWRFLLSKVLSV